MNLSADQRTQHWSELDDEQRQLRPNAVAFLMSGPPMEWPEPRGYLGGQPHRYERGHLPTISTVSKPSKSRSHIRQDPPGIRTYAPGGRTSNLDRRMGEWDVGIRAAGVGQHQHSEMDHGGQARTALGFGSCRPSDTYQIPTVPA
jgi:hypothetical protein